MVIYPVSVLIKCQFCLIVFGLVCGCSSLTYRIAGGAAEDLGGQLIMPHLLTTDDTAIACATAESLLPAIDPLRSYEAEITRLSVLVHMVSGMCAYHRAFGFHLESLRDYHEHRPDAARDARIKAKRWHGVAAFRHYQSFDRVLALYRHFGEFCPASMDAEQEFLWLMGASTALQALMNDAMSGGLANLPRRLPARIDRALACVDKPEINHRWWGMPAALRAVIWITVPGSAPEGVQPWERLRYAAELGNQGGVRTAHALLALTLDSTSRGEELKDSIRRFGTSQESFRVNPQWRLVDAFAADIVLGLSDQLWIEAQGHRTPVGQLGSFWDDPAKVVEIPTIGVQDL